MFASRWPKGLSFGPHWLTNSEVVRAVSDTPAGPYKFQEVVLPPRGEQYWDGKMTHNPVICKSGDTYLLYYTGTTYHGDMPTPEKPTTDDSPLKLEAYQHERIGLATSKSVFGPWERRDNPILDVRPNSWEQYLVSNAAPIVMPDGKIYLFYKGVEKLKKHAIGLAIAETYEGPYVRVSDKPFELGMDAEDPTVWFENGKYHMLMLDCGRKYSDKEIYSCDSNDLFHWRAQYNPVAITKNILWQDGKYRKMNSTERPQVLVENGKATYVFFATGQTVNGEKSTWNMSIPLKSQDEIKDPVQWFSDARFGMFIHWGLYSIPAGIWDGKPVHHPQYANPYCEHIMWLNKIPIKEYSKLTAQFNPADFDAEKIVKLAKDAGMKYIVFVAKHHDGFAMYKSNADAYNIVDATPYKKDPLKELSEACHKEGRVLGIYYSLGRDWHNPYAISKKTNNWDFPDPNKQDYQKYLDEKVKPQLQELLTQYGPIGILWFDTPEQTTLKQSIGLELLVKRLQPDCIVNTRVGNDVGDFMEMGDNKIPQVGQTKDWETPATMAESWGYSKLDTPEFWKSPKVLIRQMIDIASKGGNYLLNIGPDGKGNIPQLAVERLERIRDWMKVNSQAIYRTGVVDLDVPDWGRYTGKDNLIYAHIFDWPENRSLIIHVMPNKIESIVLLTKKGEKVLNYKPTYGGAVIVALPAESPDKIAAVIKITKKNVPLSMKKQL
jgi:alpha-L-fucosidase